MPPSSRATRAARCMCARLGGIAGEPQRDVRLDRRRELRRAAEETRPRAVVALLRADPVRRARGLGAADAEELAQQQVLGVHRDVGLELALPVAALVLEREQAVARARRAPSRRRRAGCRAAKRRAHAATCGSPSVRPAREQRGARGGEPAAHRAFHRRGPAGVGPGAGEVEAAVRGVARRRAQPLRARRLPEGRRRLAGRRTAARARAARAAGNRRRNSGSKQRRSESAETPTHASAAESETARYWPRSRPDARVRSKIHCSGESIDRDERLREDGAIPHDVQVHDRRAAEPGERARSRSPPPSGSSWAAAVVRRREDHRVGGHARRVDPHARDAARRELDRAHRARAAALRAPRSRSACAAGCAWTRSSGTLAQPRSAASGSFSRPVWKTIAASASDALAAGRLSVGFAIRSQKRAIARGDCAVRRRASRRSERSSSAGSARSSAASRRAATAMRSRSRSGRVAEAREARRQVKRRGQRVAAQPHARRAPLATTGIASRRWSTTRSAGADPREEAAIRACSSAGTRAGRCRSRAPGARSTRWRPRAAGAPRRA